MIECCKTIQAEVQVQSSSTNRQQQFVNSRCLNRPTHF